MKIENIDTDSDSSQSKQMENELKRIEEKANVIEKIQLHHNQNIFFNIEIN